MGRTSHAVRNLIVAAILAAFADGSARNTAERDWLAQRAIPFKPAEPVDREGDKAFRKLVGKARLVAVGECTHGTGDFFRLKARLAALLAADSKFTIFALETGMAEARQINDYILTGQGDPKQLLMGMGYWDWNTQEFLDLIRWMRGQCERERQSRVQFSGIDMQTPEQALENVRGFVHAADAAYETSFRKAFALVYLSKGPAWRTLKNASSKDLSILRSGSREVFDHLQANRARYVQSHPVADVDWTIQDARLLVQHIEYLSKSQSSTYRDRCMAENASWLLEHAPAGTRMLLSAHNDHIARSAGSMGDWLSKRFGPDYLIVGCTFHHGRYNAYPLFVSRSGGPEPQRAAVPPVGSIENELHQTGSPALILDLRQAKNEAGAAWLTRPLNLRSVGWKAQFIEFSPRVLSNEFDALIFFDEASPSKLLN
jgi:erythromycin esterase